MHSGVVQGQILEKIDKNICAKKILIFLNSKYNLTRFTILEESLFDTKTKRKDTNIIIAFKTKILEENQKNVFFIFWIFSKDICAFFCDSFPEVQTTFETSFLLMNW